MTDHHAEATNNASTMLPCCVEAPEAYRPKAEYALRMLLLPLGIDPQWVHRADLDDSGLYYGLDPDTVPASVLRLRLARETVSFFEDPMPYRSRRVRWRRWQGERWPVLFTDPETDEDDLVASAFFWLSGWQEHTASARDRHGRFPHHASLQARFGTTTRPAVDAYREHLAAALADRAVPLRRRTWDRAVWAFCPTHDIDYLRKWRKGMIYREVVPYFLRNQRRVSPGARIRRLGRFLYDWLTPRDVYRTSFERLHHETMERGGTATFFLKTGAHGPHDVFYDADDPYLRQRIAALEEDGFEIGLHPSYYAHTHLEYLHEEHSRLAAAVTQTPVSVRQHYLRYEAPATPRLQQAAGFRIDSSLGFSETEGFRHATCLPFQRFDVSANAPTDLWEMPLSMMESAVFNRRGLALAEALRATADILQTCRRFGGVAVMLWHNVLWDELDHPDWGFHFTETLDAAASEGACIASLRDALSWWLGTDEAVSRLGASESRGTGASGREQVEESEKTPTV